MIDPLLDKLADVWRAESNASAGSATPSGFPDLDDALGGGWPCPALIELLTDQEGIGELQLLLPLMAQVSTPTADNDRTVVLWLNPPHAIHAVALVQHGLDPSQHWTSAALSERDTLWGMEQALRSSACAMVIGWAQRSTTASLRRLKLATSAGRCIGVLFRPTRAALEPSPATIRAELHAHASCLHVGLLKVKGRKPTSVMVDVQRRVGGRDKGVSHKDVSS